MRDLPILTVREIKEILTLINQEDQQLLGLLAALEGASAQRARQQLSQCDRGGLRELCKVTAS